ncbi:hypothetical protein MTR_7g023620 [Medicago truncatula]|uniref:Uncharacterized protein n=1 Tax=Medicago truncatula TaxID=3880 RepID=G7KVQ7_MEDTR|nr:hypothetical protein MTR_7g023620 [Medicago truncatula]
MRKPLSEFTLIAKINLTVQGKGQALESKTNDLHLPIVLSGFGNRFGDKVHGELILGFGVFFNLN